MKKQLVTVVLALAVAAAAQGIGTPAGQQQPAQKKEIKDPAEYNSYVGAIQAPDPQQKVAGLEDFLARYPNSVVKADALEQLMGAYQQMGNGAKTMEAANRLLQADPNNLAALALNVLQLRSQITGATDPKLQQMRGMAERGVQALQAGAKPEGMSDADWARRKTAFASVFEGAVGFAALQAQDYPTAQQHLKAAVQAVPDSYADTYALAVAELQAKPMVMEGLWHAARAAALAPTPQAAQQIGTWGQGRYRRFHGEVDGWNELLASAKAQANPPAGWSVTPAPTPAEFAQKLMDTKKINELSPDEIELILSSGNQPAADKLWAGFKGVPQQFQGKIIGAPSKTTLQVAFSAAAIEDNRASVDLTMAGPIPASMAPQVGTMIPLQGIPVSYQVTPAQGANPATVMIKMNEGALLTAGGKKKPAGAKKPAPKHRR
ncbi:MAG: hypothetical protein HYX28_03380 [Candidatus Koribacter versatilis]|uniref:Tetratricopeptide repeat protein n=1 Tax=Candidatus Korobacter versatilis TaxID=658062 RepID=A0A932ENX4_9BACT|nr:hypothetical protein [Candidatus Koribacter versatilis]